MTSRTLDRLARLERMWGGPIPAPLRAWALSDAEPDWTPESIETLRIRAAAAFEGCKRQIRASRKQAIHASWSVNVDQMRYRTEQSKLLRKEARRYLVEWSDARAMIKASGRVE